MTGYDRISLQAKEEHVNQNEFRFIGISRSGNHAIINWLIKQLKGSYCFLNCAEPKHNPFSSARPLSKGGKTYKTNIPSFNLSQEQQGNLSQKDHLLYSHEDCFLGALNHPVFVGNKDKWTGRSKKRTDILILRDAFNLFASRIKANLLTGHYSHGAKPISILTLKRIYKQHAKEFISRKHLNNGVVINYNQWVTDKQYRKLITEKLGVTFSDEGFEEVTHTAGGSSFDGLRFSGKANQMNLKNRWKAFSMDEDFWRLFDQELVELNQQIFGDIEPIQHLQEMNPSGAVKNPQQASKAIPLRQKS